MNGKYYFWSTFNIISTILSAVFFLLFWRSDPGLIFIWLFIWIIANFVLYGIDEILKILLELQVKSGSRKQ